MKTLLPLALLFSATLFSATLLHAADAPRKPFPDDYTPTTCPTVSCRSYEESEMRSAAASFLGLSLDVEWVNAHLPELAPDFEKLCRKMTSCFATAPNTKLFCLDILAPEFRSICAARFPGSDNQNCRETVETYLLGLDQRMQPRFDATRQCAEQNDPPRQERALDTWVVAPAVKVPGTVVPITIYAIDRQTHVPILADIEIENQKVFAPSNPTGRMATGYGFNWPVRFVRVPNAEGHEDSMPPMVTLHADGYPPASFRLDVEVPRVIVSMTPVRTGKLNRVTVTVKDAATGEDVGGRVMIGKLGVGVTNQQFELDLRKKSKRPQVWLTELANGASDVLVK
jgi:hypothetical protein